MAQSIYQAKSIGPDRIVILSFDQEEAGEGQIGEETRVLIADSSGLIEVKNFSDGGIVDAVLSADGSDVWLLSRFGGTWSFVEERMIINFSQEPQDYFTGLSWLGPDLVLFGSNNLIRRVDLSDFSTQPIEGLRASPLPDPDDMQEMISWALNQRGTYAIKGESALNFIAARSHGELLISQEGELKTEVMTGAETTRFADLARDDEGAVWLVGANNAPRVVRWKEGAAPQILQRGSQPETMTTSVASWSGRIFVGDEGIENGGLYDATPDGVGRRWPGIQNVVALVSTPDRLWIVSTNELRVLEAGTLLEVPLDA